MKLSKIFISVGLTFGISFANASVSDAMNQFYSNVSATSNPATVVQTQSANIMSAGGFSTRSQSVTLQPFAFSKPSFSSSCGNIDFYGGAFSYLSNTDQLMKFLQNTLITAAPLIFINAMKAVSPNLAGSIMSFFDSAQKLLNLASNSCQLGTYLGTMGGGYVGNALANTQMFSSGQSGDATGSMVHNTVSGDSGGSLSNSIQGYSNTVSKWADTLNGVLNPDPSTLNGSDGAILKQLSMANGSVIWKGMQQLGNVSCSTCTSSDGMRNLSDLVVSLIGDVYIAPDSTDPMSIKAIPISPTIQNVASFYTGLPANSKVYDCPSSSYNPTKPVECFDKNITGYNQGTLSAGFKEQVMAMVQHLQNHFTSNAALNNDDLQLIAISKIPVYQMAQAMQDAGMAGQIANVLSGYSEYIAYSLTQTLMSEVNAMARSALSARNVQSNDQAKQAVMDLTSRINSIQSQLNIDGQKYANQDIVAMLQKINFLRSSAMAQYSPAMTEKIQFARAFNNN
jgi:hypothetical protein